MREKRNSCAPLQEASPVRTWSRAPSCLVEDGQVVLHVLPCHVLQELDTPGQIISLVWPVRPCGKHRSTDGQAAAVGTMWACAEGGRGVRCVCHCVVCVRGTGLEQHVRGLLGEGTLSSHARCALRKQRVGQSARKRRATRLARSRVRSHAPSACSCGQGRQEREATREVMREGLRSV